MSQSVLSLYNTALSLAQGKGHLTSTTASSPEADECNLWYPTVRDTVQEAAFWPACRQTARLTELVERDPNVTWTAGDPETNFTFAYALPSTCLRPRYLTNYEAFTVSFDATRSRTVLNTNQEDAVLMYSSRSDDPAHWTASQFLATAHGLAGYIVGALSGQSRLQDYHFNLANQRLVEAQAAIVNNESMLVEALPPSLVARGYTDNLAAIRYYHPFGALFPASNAAQL